MQLLMSIGRVAGFVLLGLLFIALPMAVFRLGLMPLAQAVTGYAHPAVWVRPAGMGAAMAVGYWAFVRVVERRPARELSARPAQALLAVALAAALIGIPILVLYGLGFYRLLGYQGVGGLAAVAVPILAAALFEELVFRALLFTALERSFGFVAALAVQSAVFAVLHIFNAGFGGWIDILAGIVIGAFWTCLYALWRNVWSLSLHHAAWNLIIAVTGLPLSGLDDFQAAAPFRSAFSGPDWISGGAAGPEPSVITLALVAAALAAAFHLARRSGAPAVRSPPRAS